MSQGSDDVEFVSSSSNSMRKKRKTSATDSVEIIEVDIDSDNNDVQNNQGGQGTLTVRPTRSLKPSSQRKDGTKRKLLNKSKPPPTLPSPPPSSAVASKPFISLVDSDDDDNDRRNHRNTATSTIAGAVVSEEDERKPSAKPSPRVGKTNNLPIDLAGLELAGDFSPSGLTRNKRRTKVAEQHKSKGNNRVSFLETVLEPGDEFEDDEKLAQRLQEEEEEYLRRAKIAKQQENESDIQLAKLLQKQEDEQSRKADPNKEEKEMTKSTAGRAVFAVQRIIELVNKAKNKFPSLAGHIDAVAIDDMVFLCENLLKQQQEFMDTNVPSYIDVGYHYSNPKNMEAIRTNGLLTLGERNAKKIQTTVQHGSVFGDGVYTANNYKSFSNYGEVGLMVGRLQGNTIRMQRSLPPRESNNITANTVVGDKMQYGSALDSEGWPLTDQYHEIVLRDSSQCLPMVKYDTLLLQKQQGEQCIKHFQQELQVILDNLFNKGCQRAAIGSIHNAVQNASSVPLRTTAARTSTRRRLAAAQAQAASTLAAAQTQMQANNASALAAGLPTVPLPNGLPGPTTMTSQQLSALFGSTGIGTNSSISAIFGNAGPATVTRSSRSSTRRRRASAHNCLVYSAPSSLVAGIPTNALIPPPRSCNLNEDCVICQDQLSSAPSVALAVCNHVFHSDCVKRALKSKPECPICRKTVGAPQGKSPSGTMYISTSAIHCSGYNEDSIVITYSIKSGTQKTYHDNPGQPQPGKHATAYIPNNADGKNLLKRLKYAFLHGLIFTVGTSATTGISNQCTWSSVHHKTSPSGGVRAHGFPDPSYFVNCNDELTAVGVPKAHLLNDDGSDV